MTIPRNRGGRIAPVSTVRLQARWQLRGRRLDKAEDVMRAACAFTCDRRRGKASRFASRFSRSHIDEGEMNERVSYMRLALLRRHG
ncbi:hypothetical protein HMPREF0762_00899 [Slackia exigua ATCC 700122]|uniref:Uncharacterized protein n=1 Tax=Slackia exigua (strain ATCC 700122 / DSM 15923 / CIP 105133 / JCM 11022 / KCTC 5966 / S-7) TaxID=649764 RepID=D0WGE8_SLAES|nr:hypothetical protein HMPREF0762_00899 [Slackia exigua ATCC 700122]